MVERDKSPSVRVTLIIDQLGFVSRKGWFANSPVFGRISFSQNAPVGQDR